MKHLLPLLLAATATISAEAAQTALPAGTTVYAELQQRLTSKKGVHKAGEPARATVWRDVVVDGRTLIKAGTSMRVQIKAIQHKRLTGRRGQLELAALSVAAVDGTPVELDGGYRAGGQQRMALASSLSSAIDWSMTLVKGKEAVLPKGTIFDAQVRVSTRVSPRPEAAGGGKGGIGDFTVQVLYDGITDKETHLPMEITRCGIVIGEPAVVTVNAVSLDAPVPVEVLSQAVVNQCVRYRARLELKKLGRSFVPGINRFEIQSQEDRQEVILDVEL